VYELSNHTKEIKVKVTSAFRFVNGNWAAFDSNDEQIPELQLLYGYTIGQWATKAIELGYDISDCDFKIQ
jgi:hypothetical protein